MTRTRPGSDNSPRVFEWEMDLPRVVFVGILALGALLAAFALGRWTSPKAPETLFATSPASSHAAEDTTVRDISDEATIFDRAGEGAAERASDRQITPEVLSEGRYEVEVGVTAKRSQAEAWRARLKQLGLDSYVVHAGQGRYRVAAGPFETETEAERVSRRLTKVLGRSMRVTHGPRAE